MTVKEFCYKVRKKIKKIYIRYFTNPGLNYNLNDAAFNWKTYKYLKKKYKYVIDNHKVSKNRNISNKVWWCWLQGEENAPDICKANLNSLRKNLRDREIIVITEENYSDYIKLPDYIIKKYKKGIITRTHFSDILRLQLLITHGGTWIDSSVLSTSYSKEFFDKPLFVFKNMLKEDKSIVLSSWFITSESNNPTLTLARDIIFEYWKHNSVLVNYFLMHISFTIASEKYEKEWKNVHTYSNVPPHVLQFEMLNEFDPDRWEEIKKISSIHKLTQKVDKKDIKENSYFNYIIKAYK